ncbi:phenoloxidase-activating factor 1 isoform X1 [Procambarus clarkii]|uniref:phenoloxidase-activating factor 1 isoform X1 n=2 Tax=Procambarus clarkii TaxID=6728 RepID=UPI0037429E28
MAQRVHCALPGWCSVPLLLLLLLQMTAAQRADCPHPCIPLSQCPEMRKLLEKPTLENISALRRATCTYETDPKVCCPSKPTTTPPSTPKTSLLPRNCGQGADLDKVVGGTAAPLGAYRWIAALGYSVVGFPGIEFLCGGSVINERYILTAAHCVHSSALAGKKLEVIRLGEWDLKSDLDCLGIVCIPQAQDNAYEEVIIHPNYNTRVQFSDDIALIRLNKSIDLSTPWIRAVCLPPQGLDVSKFAPKHKSFIAGWGFTENGTTSSVLLHVLLPYFSKENCSISYRGNIVDEQICFGGIKGQDSCGGDSGGPLVMSSTTGPPFLQVGLVSYGPVNCGQKDVPGVYTSVSHYRNWIETNMRP